LVETAWFKSQVPPESTKGPGGPFKHRHEKIPAGTIHQWDAGAARGEFPIPAGAKLFVTVFLDPQDPPSEILLQLRSNGSYDHRAF
jgi:hypothetical protein